MHRPWNYPGDVTVRRRPWAAQITLICAPYLLIAEQPPTVQIGEYLRTGRGPASITDRNAIANNGCERIADYLPAPTA